VPSLPTLHGAMWPGFDSEEMVRPNCSEIVYIEQSDPFLWTVPTVSNWCCP